MVLQMVPCALVVLALFDGSTCMNDTQRRLMKK
jgi:hypothetical protein